MKPSTLAISLITAAAVEGIIIRAANAHHRKKKKADKRQQHPSDHHPDWNCVDEASWESFPASDPPGKY